MVKLISAKFNNNHVHAYSVPAFDEEGHNFNLGLNGIDDIQTMKNREALASQLHISLSHMILPHQEHTVNFAKVTLADGGKGMYSLDTALPATDATYTRDAGLVLWSSHADCCPVLMYSPDQHLIAAIHSGWKGTVHEIVGKVTKHLIDNEHVNPTNLLVYTGPALEQRNFEAMDDIIDLVKAMSFDTSSFYRIKDETHYTLNTKGLIKQQLLNLGVKEEHIEQSPICTFEDERFFSYRKTKTKDRNMSIIYMLD
jgi:YfiH family protein